METLKANFELIPKSFQSWQDRPEWFFNREHTDTYELWYGDHFQFAEISQKNIMENLVKSDPRISTLLEFGCGNGRFTRWWNSIGIEAFGGDISPFMLCQARHFFEGDLVMADSHYMPYKDNSFDALAFITSFEYYKDPVKIIKEAARVSKYGIVLGMMNRNSTYVIRRRFQEIFAKNPMYLTATFYTPKSLTEIINKALEGRKYKITWNCTGLPKWFPIQEWNVPLGDFFGLYVEFQDVE